MLTRLFGRGVVHGALQRTAGLRGLSSSAGLDTIIDPSFELTSDQRAIQSTALQFALNEFRPRMAEWDQAEVFPRDIVKQCVQLGFGGLYISTDDGGAGLSRLETSVVIEALAQGCVSTTAMISIHNMVASMLAKFGDQQLKKRYLQRLIDFDLMASYCLTEPGSGSDAASLATTAVRDGDDYIVNGTKAFISGGGESDLYCVFVRTGGPGPKGISCLLIEKGTKGLSFGKKERKLGWNSQPTRAVVMEDCRVPVANRVGEEGHGFRFAMEGINGGRLNIASCSLGAAQWALEETLKYTGERRQFERAIFDFQHTQFKLAELASRLLASRLLVRAAARRIDDDEVGPRPEMDNGNIPLAALAAAGKLVATEEAFKIIDACLQMFGGYGYLKDFPIQQLLRDSRVHRILEGSNEIMQLIIARSLGGGEAAKR